MSLKQNLKQSLKESWNRIQCKMDAAGVNMFVSPEVNEEMARQGWTVKFNHYLVGAIARPCAISIPDVTNPRGEKVHSFAQYSEYRAARREAALRVYGLK